MSSNEKTRQGDLFTILDHDGKHDDALLLQGKQDSGQGERGCHPERNGLHPKEVTSTCKIGVDKPIMNQWMMALKARM